MPTIVAGRCDSYDVALLKAFFASALTALGCSFSGLKVLLKPNLLSGKAPPKAVNTHPLFVDALAQVFLDNGCTVFIGDSPGYESTERALEKSGIMAVAAARGLHIAPFRRKVSKINAGVSPYREFFLGEDPLDYDLVVNLPKLKSHVMMGITAGVKNTFGFIPSLDKARWHLRCGRDTELFAAVLIDIHTVVRPALTVLDGITIMDGDGPGSGRVRPGGLVALTDNAFCLDAFLERLLAAPLPLPISALAARHGLLPDARIVDWGIPDVPDFRFPGTMRVDWNLPSFVRQTARHIMVRKPRCNQRKCTLCRTCVDVCPAAALEIRDDRLRFDYTKCIRCYCCQEMCPTGAITIG
jgi:uncharacterized protein (DUF362 family)/NAD-dependent dihydropyrimidine dehydrogenase PreA subunit